MRRMLLAAALLGAAWLSPMFAPTARAETETVCDRAPMTGRLTCHTADDDSDGFASHYQRSYNQLEAMRMQKLRRQVGSLVATGRCEEARTLALRGGDLDLAQQVQDLCRAPADPQKGE